MTGRGRMSDNMKLVLLYMDGVVDAPAGLTTMEIARGTGLPREKARQCLAALYTQGRVGRQHDLLGSHAKAAVVETRWMVERPVDPIVFRCPPNVQKAPPWKASERPPPPQEELEFDETERKVLDTLRRAGHTLQGTGLSFIRVGLLNDSAIKALNRLYRRGLCVPNLHREVWELTEAGQKISVDTAM